MNVLRRLQLLAAITASIWLCGAGVAGATNWLLAISGASHGQAHAQALPTSPSGLTPACGGSTGSTVNLTWTGVSHATSYTIYRSTTSATSGFASTASGVTGTSWTSGVLSNATYWWRISALVGSNWLSAQSATSTTATMHSTGTHCTVP